MNKYTFDVSKYLEMYIELHGWISVTTNSFLNTQNNKKRQRLYDDLVARYNKTKGEQQ